MHQQPRSLRCLSIPNMPASSPHRSTTPSPLVDTRFQMHLVHTALDHWLGRLEQHHSMNQHQGAPRGGGLGSASRQDAVLGWGVALMGAAVRGPPAHSICKQQKAGSAKSRIRCKGRTRDEPASHRVSERRRYWSSEGGGACHDGRTRAATKCEEDLSDAG